jgi:Nucleotidyltransferase of unknown function (DUF6036)
LAGRKASLRTRDDLMRAMRAVARHFNTDTVYLIGSQAILASWPDAPSATRASIEFDAYPGNAAAWEIRNSGLEASEEINAIFGFGSRFHVTFGFYIDGVDEKTATLPPDWLTRAVRLRIKDDERTITAIAPSLDDLIVSKLARLDDKDKHFVAACHEAKPLDLDRIRGLLEKANLDVQSKRDANRFLESMSGRA